MLDARVWVVARAVRIGRVFAEHAAEGFFARLVVVAWLVGGWGLLFEGFGGFAGFVGHVVVVEMMFFLDWWGRFFSRSLEVLFPPCLYNSDC